MVGVERDRPLRAACQTYAVLLSTNVLMGSMRACDGKTGYPAFACYGVTMFGPEILIEVYKIGSIARRLRLFAGASDLPVRDCVWNTTLCLYLGQVARSTVR